MHALNTSPKQVESDVKISVLLAIGLLAFAGIAYAEGNCPPGSYPIGGQGAVGCAPIPDGDAPASANSSSSKPVGRWKKTWGAIAVDPIVGDMGTTAGKFSEREAKREAITLCEKHGAKKCEVMSYHNQCGVVAWPDVKGAKVIMQGGPSIEVAGQLALTDCKAKAGSACRIVHSECSEPVLLK